MSEEFRARQVFIRRILDTEVSPGEMDWLHRFDVQAMNMLNGSPDTTCRYYADHTGWRVDMMDGGRSPPLRGELGDYPEWLAVILDVAKIGGHIAVWEGPDKRPTQTMWFRIDKQHQLVKFVDWMK